MADVVRRRTVRAQVTNGALEAKAYQGPTGIPASADAHKTFEMQTVAVAREADPRFRKTVARGMGEAVHVLEGDIVDPETGRVLPPVGADPNPGSPWRVGKRPTKLKLPAPDPRVLLATTGVAASAASRPGVLAYLGAGAVVVIAVAAALFFANRAREAPASSAPDVRPAVSGDRGAAEAVVPPTAAAPGLVAPAPSAAAPSASANAELAPAPTGPAGASAPPISAPPTPAPGAAPPPNPATNPATTPSANPSTSKKGGGRIF